MNILVECDKFKKGHNKCHSTKASPGGLHFLWPPNKDFFKNYWHSRKFYDCKTKLHTCLLVKCGEMENILWAKTHFETIGRLLPLICNAVHKIYIL